MWMEGEPTIEEVPTFLIPPLVAWHLSVSSWDVLLFNDFHRFHLLKAYLSLIHETSNHVSLHHRLPRWLERLKRIYKNCCVFGFCLQGLEPVIDCGWFGSWAKVAKRGLTMKINKKTSSLSLPATIQFQSNTVFSYLLDFSWKNSSMLVYQINQTQNCQIEKPQVLGK